MMQGLNHVRTLKGHEHKVMALVFVEMEVPLCISSDRGGGVSYSFGALRTISQWQL
ncbi:hypothetical protein Hanom_Chr16g01471241 [Helianthus anomalus]